MSQEIPETPGPEVPVPPPTDGWPTQEEKMLGLFCHLGGALLGFVVPLVLWLVKREQSRFLDHHGKEALNFQITLLIAHVVGGLLICFTFGLINIAAWVIGLVFGILAGVEANKGQLYRYPFNIRLIT